MRFPLLALIAITSLSTGCDPERKNACEWYLMPNVVRQTRVDEGYIPVCARNLKIGKEDCRLQTTLKFATKVHQRPFRYVDMKVKTYGLPRTIDSIKFCD